MLTNATRLLLGGVSLLFALAAPWRAQAQSADEFYKGRQISMIVYSAAGSTYDLYARVLARFMGNHIPGQPTLIVQNMVGAGGLKAVEYLYRIAPKDGSVIGTIGRGLPFEPLLGKTEIPFDPFKFTWLGSMNREVSLAISWHTAKVKTLADLKQNELIIPGTGAGADSEIIPRAINSLAGTKFKIIPGYRVTTEAALAMERGELDGIGYWAVTSLMAAHENWVRDRKVNLLFHTGSTPIKELPQVPSIRSAVTDKTDLAALDFLLAREVIGRPYLAPPDIPADRAQALRRAFLATLKDPAFLAEAERAKIDIDPVTAEQVDALLKQVAAMPPAVLDRVKQALGRD